MPRKKTRVSQYTSETIDTNVCCTCFRTYDEDVLEGTGADCIACACGRWLHKDCAEDCVQDDSGNDCFCPLCIDLLTVQRSFSSRNIPCAHIIIILSLLYMFESA